MGKGGDSVNTTYDDVKQSHPIFLGRRGKEDGSEDVPRDANQSTEDKKAAKQIVQENEWSIHARVVWIFLDVRVVYTYQVGEFLWEIGYVFHCCCRTSKRL